MNQKTVAIALLPHCIDVVALRGGHITGGRRIPVALETDPNEWAKAVRQSGQTLRGAVEALGVLGARARVLYVSPTQSVDQISMKVGAAADAQQAALLAGTDSLPYSNAVAVSEAIMIGRDREAGMGRQTHFVVLAERDDVAGAIVEMVTASGLKFGTSTPVEAAIIARTVEATLHESGDLSGRLYIGHYSSFFLVAAKGNLRFGRRIALGTETLITSLTRPIRVPGRAKPVELTREVAAELIHRVGIANLQRETRWPEGLTASQVMPLLQPVLQRFVVELRQSLRFSLSDADRRGLAIVLYGLGSTVPGLSDLVSAELALTTSVATGYAGYDATKPDTEGSELRDAVEDAKFLERANLMPHELAYTRRLSRVKHWLWTGAAAAVLAIAGQFVYYGNRVTEAHRHADVLNAENSQQQTLSVTRDRMIAAVKAMKDLQGLVDQEISMRPDLCALLQEFTQLTPSSIRLTYVAVQRGADGVTGNAIGFKFESPEMAGSGRPLSLDGYIERLQASPLLDRVVLRNVRMTMVDGWSAQRFDVSFSLSPAPPEAAEPHLASTGEGEQP